MCLRAGGGFRGCTIQDPTPTSSSRIQITHRDPGDVEILALALALKRPLWNNDKDFGATGAQTLTTAELLAIYFPR